MVQDDLNGPMADVMKGIIRMINKEGYGIFHWPDGRIYEGAWKEGKQNGYGRYINQRGEEKYGFWSNGKRDRWLTREEFEEAKNQLKESGMWRGNLKSVKFFYGNNIGT